MHGLSNIDYNSLCSFVLEPHSYLSAERENQTQ